MRKLRLNNLPVAIIVILDRERTVNRCEGVCHKAVDEDRVNDQELSFKIGANQSIKHHHHLTMC